MRLKLQRLSDIALSLIAAVAFLLSILVLLVGLAIQIVGWNVVEELRGPFPSWAGSPSAGDSRAVETALKPEIPFRHLLSSGGDTSHRPQHSALRARIGDRRLGPAHAVHTRILAEGGGAYSHWGEVLIFSLPDGVANNRATVLTVEYSLRPSPAFLGLASVTLFLSGAYFRVTRRRRQRTVVGMGLGEDRTSRAAQHRLQAGAAQKRPAVGAPPVRTE
jgi:hypothetical protein